MLLVREGHGYGFAFTECISYFSHYSDMILNIDKRGGGCLGSRLQRSSVPHGGDGMAAEGISDGGSVGTGLFTF